MTASTVAELGERLESMKFLPDRIDFGLVQWSRRGVVVTVRAEATGTTGSLVLLPDDEDTYGPTRFDIGPDGQGPLRIARTEKDVVEWLDRLLDLLVWWKK